GIREICAQRGDGWRGQDQVTNPFELEEENVHCLAKSGRRADRRRLRNWCSLNLHSEFVSAQQSRSEMVPGEILNHAASCCAAHLVDYFRMGMQMFDRRRDRIDISRLHDDSLHAIAHQIACFACSDLWQTAGSRLVGDFGAALPL